MMANHCDACELNANRGGPVLDMLWHCSRCGKAGIITYFHTCKTGGARGRVLCDACNAGELTDNQTFPDPDPLY